MTDIVSTEPGRGPLGWYRRVFREDTPFEGRHAAAALERHKIEGMELAFRARCVAMAVIAVMLPFVIPAPAVLYNEALVLVFVAIGWLQRRYAQVGRSSVETLLIAADLALMTFVLLAPNPFLSEDWPLAMQYRTQAFMYFFVLFAFGTLAYSWRTVWAMGTVTSALWLAGFAAIWLFQEERPELTAAARAAFGEGELAAFLDPNSLLGFIRVQQIVVCLIVAGTLALTVRRYRTLLMDSVVLERERANLARYFSPNVVDELSHNDDPLKQVRAQNVAVLFVDIVGFTKYASRRSSEDVIATLRDFHGLMEAEVFRHGGTLDKYLGDGLMATFGTPFAGERDAADALTCAREMMRVAKTWNDARAASGEAVLPVSFGIHYGPVVLGDIGSNRLEFAVIGDTVNIASRVEGLTRRLAVELAVTDALIKRVEEEAPAALGDRAALRRIDGLSIRGSDATWTIWTMGSREA